MAAAFVAQASRTKILAMPVATTRRLVAQRNIEALVKASLPRASPNHSAAYPNSSISATASWASGTGRALRSELQRPTSPPKTARSGFSLRDFLEVLPLPCCGFGSTIILLLWLAQIPRPCHTMRVCRHASATQRPRMPLLGTLVNGGDSFLERTALAVASGSPPVGEREVVTVSLVVLVQLPDAGESRAVVAELCAAALSEPRGVASQCQLPAVEPDRVDSMDAARVEVLHREVVLALHHADHAERVGKVGVLVDRTLDQEPATFEPLVGGRPRTTVSSTIGWVISIVHSPISAWNGSSFALGSASSITLLRSRFRGILPCRYLRSAARS